MGAFVKALVYSPWHTPHESDAGAVNRAVTAVAMEYGRALYYARDGKLPVLTQETLDSARSLAYFVVSHVAERDVCDLDQALIDGLAAARASAGTFEERERVMADALRAYIGGFEEEA